MNPPPLRGSLASLITTLSNFSVSRRDFMNVIIRL